MKIANKVALLSLILPYGGGNCLFGVEDKSVPLFRGNVSMVEVKSIDTNPTKLPEVEPIYTGKLNASTTRCFDLFCVGKYEQGSELKLNIQPADNIPNLIVKNANGSPVFAEPKPICTIQGLKGHNVWVNVELETISTKASGYMCLGIKKQGEDDYFDILYTGNVSRYVDVMESDIVELIPLVSSTPLSTKYTPVKPGDAAKITSDDTYDFGSVYRVHIVLSNERWLKDQKCNLNEVYKTSSGYNWACNGGISSGPVLDQNGFLHNNQLVMVNVSGKLAHSPNGIHWFDAGSVVKGEENLSSGSANEWHVHPVYGNGIWCTINWSADKGVRRSIDYGKTWSDTLANIGARGLAFGNGVFMTVTSDGIIYASADAENWMPIGTIPAIDEYKVLIWGNNYWICGGTYGKIYGSNNGKGVWQHLCTLSNNGGNWFGGCYMNGYFYIIQNNKVIKRSLDGVSWEDVISHLTPQSYNIGYYKNKLYIFPNSGDEYHVGLFNPDGTI